LRPCARMHPCVYVSVVRVRACVRVRVCVCVLCARARMCVCVCARARVRACGRTCAHTSTCIRARAYPWLRQRGAAEHKLAHTSTHTNTQAHQHTSTRTRTRARAHTHTGWGVWRASTKRPVRRRKLCWPRASHSQRGRKVTCALLMPVLATMVCSARRSPAPARLLCACHVRQRGRARGSGKRARARPHMPQLSGACRRRMLRTCARTCASTCAP